MKGIPMTITTVRPARRLLPVLLAGIATAGLLAPLAAGIPAIAQEAPATPARQAPPPGDPPKDFRVATPETYTLDNGLQVTLVPFGTVPKATIQLVVRTGGLDEQGKFGLASMTAQLMGEGAGGLSAAQISRKAGGMGGSVGTGAGTENSAVTMSVLSEFVPDAIGLLATVALKPDFPAADLERIRANTLRGLAVQRTQAQTQAGEAFAKALYADHPFGTLFPPDEMVKGYSVDDVKSFYAQNFTAGRARLYIAGRFDAAAVKAAVAEAFGGWAKGPEATLNPPTAAAALSLHLVERPGAVQSTIYLGLPVPPPGHPDEVALQVMNVILGGGFSSRITRNLREDKGYTYSPRSLIQTRYRDAVWVQVADVTAANTGDSLVEIFKEIDRIRREPPSAKELEGVKANLSGTFVLRAASATGLIGELSSLDHHGKPFAAFADYVKAVQAVTAEDVMRVAREHIDPARMTLVIVGDTATVKPQLSKVEQIRSVLPAE